MSSTCLCLRSKEVVGLEPGGWGPKVTGEGGGGHGKRGYLPGTKFHRREAWSPGGTWWASPYVEGTEYPKGEKWGPEST